jgi:hypothetical protein
LRWECCYFWWARGHELHSLAATPAQLWINVAAEDYHLLSTAPAVDRGQARLDVPTDLDGNLRPSGAAYDMGACEFRSSVPVQTFAISGRVTAGGGGLVARR